MELGGVLAVAVLSAVSPDQLVRNFDVYCLFGDVRSEPLFLL